MTLQEIIDANPDKVNYFVQNEGNIDPTLRYLVNSWDENSVYIQQIDTNIFFDIPIATSGYEVYTPPLEDPLSPYKEIIGNAIEFFQSLIIEFGATNITQGITYYGKTKDVADYLATVMRYGQSGSLYEVRNEILNLHAGGIPADLAPFVTEASMQGLLNKVETYLNVTPQTDWS